MMETILALIVVIFLVAGGISLFFLLAVQPIWGVVDVAISKEHSGGTKAAVILLTLLLLGPIMTFFYACFSSPSRIFRRLTVTANVVGQRGPTRVGDHVRELAIATAVLGVAVGDEYDAFGLALREKFFRIECVASGRFDRRGVRGRDRTGQLAHDVSL